MEMAPLITTLAETGFEVRALKRSEATRIFARWCETFMESVKARTGKYRHLGLHWHAFSYGLVKAASQKAAFDQYFNLPPEPGYIIPESWKHGAGVFCTGPSLPDLTNVHDDLYVFPESLEWTMAFTHEQPKVGPYFTRREWCRIGE
jgi:hypothetical protein